MDLLFTLVVFFGALTLLVFVHELGHFLPARWFGIRVEKFYIFFDWPRKLFSIRRGGTEYGIGVLPLGGYVKIAGMVDESLDDEAIKQEKAGAPPQPDEFRAKPVWQRLIVMVGGVTFNVILAIAIFTGIKFTQGDARIRLDALPHGLQVVPGSVGADLGLKTGDRLLSFNGEAITYLPQPRDVQRYLIADQGVLAVQRGSERLELTIPPDYLDRISGGQLTPLLGLPNPDAVIAYVDSAGPGARAGLRPGDRILAIDSTPIASFGAMRAVLSGRAGQNVALTVQRGGSTQRLTAVLDSAAKLQVDADYRSLPIERVDYSPLQALGLGVGQAFGAVGDQVAGFRKIFAGQVSASKAVAGPVKIAGFVSEATRSGGAAGWWQIVGLLSMILAVVNILPIPALDGGHVVFLLIEAVTGREPSLKLRLVAQQVGMVLLLALMTFVLLNDTITSIWR